MSLRTDKQRRHAMIKSEKTHFPKDRRERGREREKVRAREREREREREEDKDKS